jgi:hypothetical protein
VFLSVLAPIAESLYFLPEINLAMQPEMLGLRVYMLSITFSLTKHPQWIGDTLNFGISAYLWCEQLRCCHPAYVATVSWIVRGSFLTLEITESHSSIARLITRMKVDLIPITSCIGRVRETVEALAVRAKLGC